VDARTRVSTLPARQQCTQSAAVRTTAALENAAAAAAPAALLAPASPTTSLSTVTLLIQMMGKRVDASAFKYADVQIEEKIKQHKIDLKKSCPDTGMLPLRAAIRAPWGEDRDLRSAISKLRSAGETVVCVLPGHENEIEEFHCDRVLEAQGTDWHVVPIQK
jgi:hypothetical protein